MQISYSIGLAGRRRHRLGRGIRIAIVTLDQAVWPGINVESGRSGVQRFAAHRCGNDCLMSGYDRTILLQPQFTLEIGSNPVHNGEYLSILSH